MPTVEQSVTLAAPSSIIMDALNDVETIPTWATVPGTITDVQGSGTDMTYSWQYSINKLRFKGTSQVIEQTENTLITKTTGDVDSIWTINLTPITSDITTMQVVVEYIPPNSYIELMVDILLDQMNNPEVAHQNMARFKEMVEERARIQAKQILTQS
jgi:uncharacterized membrane protein